MTYKFPSQVLFVVQLFCMEKATTLFLCYFSKQAKIRRMRKKYLVYFLLHQTQIKLYAMFS